ncbi:hypothetical protein [Lihuaxuella thermophila]|uniref:Uncharacterized protein n=1 Tax=Lihuaxuella thermophila TaxID=1173111 RepID=A0A1H8CPG8_9BACL|nr:hypothetical protein [Lihuaxuella thermophila]SEM96866.1 hypothetical protein SAMN05444955_10439 [Lihuaxuella thermophila]
MRRNKHKFRVLCGLGLLVVAFPQLPVELSGELDSVFSFSWLTLALLAIAANWSRMQQTELLRRYREEARRREQWLEAERRWRHTHGRTKRGQSRIHQSV